MRPSALPDLALAALLLAACAAPARRPVADLRRDPRATLAAFAGAVAGERWAEAWTLLSPRWRARTTPALLAADARGAGAVAIEAAARVEALLAAGAALEPDGAGLRLPEGDGRGARLVPGDAGWAVDALE